MKKRLLSVLVLGLGLAAQVANAATANRTPVANAGPSRYAAEGPVQLDGKGSYDPDDSGPLGYAWRQTSGPSLAIADADTATPTISGFIQTDAIQECEFELTVSDGELTSEPDVVEVIIVPDFGVSTLVLENPPFDTDRPTVIYFGGGDCTNGLAVDGWSPFTPAWLSRANIIHFPNGYTPDGGGGERTYYRYADMIIVYLSAAAPNYSQRIQTSGWSTGGQPAVDVGIRLNLIYADARYAINRVTFFDALRYCRAHYRESVATFLGSSVDGEQCWADAYVSATSGGEGFVAGPSFQANVLNVGFPDATGGWYQRHILASGWYADSLELAEMNQFNHGAVAGAYWSVVGPGKNLQLASTPGTQTYRFEWYGDASSGYMDFHNEADHPGRLPEPVTLAAWIDVSDTSQNLEGAVLTCHESENAIGYELLSGSEPHRVMDYRVLSDTPHPPLDVIRGSSAGESWWTIRVRDRHGSTIYADPIRLDLTGLPLPSVENARTGMRYGLIGLAILDAEPNDVILLDPGTYEENITFAGKSLTVSSLDPSDPVTVAGTIVKGLKDDATVTFSGQESAGCVLAGLTIQGERAAVSCCDAAPVLRNCILESPGGIAIEFWHGREPSLVDCTVSGQTKEGGDLGLLAYWKLDETEGMIASDSEGDYDATVMGVPLWQPEGGMIGGALQFSGMPNFASAQMVRDPSEGPLGVFAWIKGGAPGQVIVSQQAGANWLMADALDGSLMTDLRASGRSPVSLGSQTVIADGNWHRVGFTWDGANRRLYVDDALVAEDTQAALEGSAGKQLIGCGANMSPDTFFTGLIDDVRIYNRVVKP
jgi:hypothetical protein